MMENVQSPQRATSANHTTVVHSAMEIGDYSGECVLHTFLGPSDTPADANTRPPADLTTDLNRRRGILRL